MNERMVYITVPSEDVGATLAKSLLEDRLIACANMITGVRSLYRWEGRLNDDPEVIIIAKTTALLVDELISRVKEQHPYECPCVVSLEIKEGNPDFLSWINSECRQ